MAYYAYCSGTGALHFGPHIPEGYLPVARMPPEVTRIEEWRAAIELLCRKGYEPGHYLVPGVPEATTSQLAADQLLSFTKLLGRRGLTMLSGHSAKRKKGALT